mmetsp:Transcript_12545/g.16363  ORF Transcript_12545/g.16363 Transcript_12545/m.16363 type:complete len:634 (+) Transcript_12545:163-2064(+)
MEKNSLILQFSLKQPLCPTEDSAPGIGEYYKISEKEEVTSTSSDLERINEKLKLRLNGVSNHDNVDTASTVKCQPFLLRNVCSCDLLSQEEAMERDFCTSDEASLMYSKRRRPADLDFGNNSLVALIIPNFVRFNCLDGGKKMSSCFKDDSSESCQRIMWEIFEKTDAETFLRNIHSSINVDQFCGVMAVQSSRSNSSFDVLLLWDNKTSSLLDKLNCETISSNSTYILKPLPLSYVVAIGAGKHMVTKSDKKNLFKLPFCPVCLHRIDARFIHNSFPKAKLICSQLCLRAEDDVSSDMSLCKIRSTLIPWCPPFTCQACSVIMEYMANSNYDDVYEYRSSIPDLNGSFPNKTENTLKCTDCEMAHTLWVCLTCGYTGCGRYSSGHAWNHFQSTNHPFSLEIVTNKIWSYASDTFVHRVDFLRCPFLKPEYYDVNVRERDNVWHESFSISGKPFKKTSVSEEYQIYLQNALEDQAMHYEEMIARLCSDLASKADAETNKSTAQIEEVESLRYEVEKLRQSAEKQAGTLLHEQNDYNNARNMYQKLLQEQALLKKQIDDITLEIKKEKNQGEEEAAELHNQITDIATFLSMQKQIKEDSELQKADIISTSAVPSQNVRDKKSKSGRGGKKGRRR